ncbi:hypothetical protein GGI21_003297 [Coemansia aciculifera]|nr:hypothetical protein GGI21_003297 [Coemansia aciculifera]
MTQPGTPNLRGQSQKTITPQIMESFRRQLSEERSMSPAFRASRSSDFSENGASDDDDDYYNALVESVSAKYTNGKSSANSTSELAASSQSATPRAAGKSLAPNWHHSSGWSSPMGGGKGRGRGRGASSSMSKNRHRASYAGDGEIKPPSYNLPWSDEEQTRLEELLVIYPDEEVSNNRWRKISEALGTRTMRQVSSRVQKYFIKLAKAGLPVPGRAPDTSSWAPRPQSTTTSVNHSAMPRPKRRRTESGSGYSSRGTRKYVDFTSSSGEEDEENVKTRMYEDMNGLADTAQPYDRKGKQADRSGNESFDMNSSTTYELSHAGGSNGNGMFISSSNGAGPSSAGLTQPSALRSAKVVHLGYRCDSCFSEPIVGIRWHCLDCRGAQAVDLCDECREEGVFETATHRTVHRFHAKREAEMEPFYANEVAATALREFSYLA